MTTPTSEDREDLLLSCRYGDLDDVQHFVSKFTPHPLSEIRDENGNTILHMICGNGHMDLLDYILPLVPSSLLSEKNNAQSTPLHWACLNSHLETAQKLVRFSGGPGIDLIDIKNSAGLSPLAEAELAGWDEGAKWLVEVMNLNDDAEAETTEELVVDPSRDIQVEIQDADGQVAKMTISGSAAATSSQHSSDT